MTKNRWLFRKTFLFVVCGYWQLYADDMAFFTLFDSILLLTLQLKRSKWWNKLFLWWFDDDISSKTRSRYISIVLFQHNLFGTTSELIFFFYFYFQWFQHSRSYNFILHRIVKVVERTQICIQKQLFFFFFFFHFHSIRVRELRNSIVTYAIDKLRIISHVRRLSFCFELIAFSIDYMFWLLLHCLSSALDLWAFFLGFNHMRDTVDSF